MVTICRPGLVRIGQYWSWYSYLVGSGDEGSEEEEEPGEGQRDVGEEEAVIEPEEREDDEHERVTVRLNKVVPCDRGRVNVVLPEGTDEGRAHQPQTH